MTHIKHVNWLCAQYTILHIPLVCTVIIVSFNYLPFLKFQFLIKLMSKASAKPFNDSIYSKVKLNSKCESLCRSIYSSFCSLSVERFNMKSICNTTQQNNLNLFVVSVELRHNYKTLLKSTYKSVHKAFESFICLTFCDNYCKPNYVLCITTLIVSQIASHHKYPI